MKNEDKMIQLAFSVYSNPGVYALLLGSGVSRGAEILTGWEIMIELIRKIAYTMGDKDIKNPYNWYLEKYYNEEPTYPNLLKRLARTEKEREGILREYFEPTGKDIENKKKIPTIVHRAIAKLVKNGYVKVILTTNFDRLIEKALEEEGVNNYQVLSTNNKINGMTPYPHKVTIVKLHGDYIEGEMKNTENELAKYSRKKNQLLNRIFDDFGLIVCGWSAEYDTALRNALYRRKNRRYSTYWTIRNRLKEKAKALTEHLDATVIKIDNADTFFDDLWSKIDSLKQYNKPHPLSVPIAIEETKKYLSEDKYFIKLEELVNKETEKVFNEFKEKFYGDRNKWGDAKSLKYAEAKLEILIGILTTIAYYDSGNNSKLLTKAIERFVNFTYRATYYRYEIHPAIILLYTVGISALAGEKYKNLAAVLLKPKIKKDKNFLPLTEIVNPPSMDDYIKTAFKENYGRRKTPVSDYLFDNLKEKLKNYIDDANLYSNIFDVFEYLSGLVHLWLTLENNPEDRIWAPIGRFIRKWNLHQESKFFLRRLLTNNIKKDSELLKTGFFNGDIEKFKECYKKYEIFLSGHCSSYW